MDEVNGTLEQCRTVDFPKSSVDGLSECPLKNAEVAIVPVRYALDRSRFDADPKLLKPLLACGTWADLPALQTRSYTLRQLYDGYVYVYDETAKTFHEYVVTTPDANLARIVWTDAQIGKDSRSGATDAKRCLLYPKKNRLHMAFSPHQWTWRLCEKMRSNADSRAQWMKPLDLSSYCETMAEPGTLPLTQIADAVADIDLSKVTQDQRFDDSSVPTNKEKQLCAPVRADVCWAGSVPQPDSALIIALDDPLGVLSDLGLQLAAEQAAVHAWQAEHDHKLQMAQVVTNLCASSDDPSRLPSVVKHDVVRTQGYLSEVDAYLERRLLQQSGCIDSAACDAISMEIVNMAAELRAKYGVIPSEEDFDSWSKRAKWRQEVDHQGARAYISMHKPVGDLLMSELHDTQNDLMIWAEHIGLDPHTLFVDTTNPDSLLYLQSIMSDLLTLLVQDIQTHDWLIKQEDFATSLFGTLRYGFSAGIKKALDEEADQLLNGLGDYTNLATRVGEFNGLINHSDIAQSRFVQSLKESSRETFQNLGELAAGKGKAIAETIMTAWLPLDSRRVRGQHESLAALLRTLIIGRVLIDSPERLVIDAETGKRVKNWKRELLVIEKHLRDLEYRWLYPSANGYDRESLSRQKEKIKGDLRRHYLQIPALFDFQNNHYSRLMNTEIHNFLESGLSFEHWQARAEGWSSRLGTGIAVGVTWGVVMINFISTGFLLADLTRDGDFSGRDVIKVSYGLAYTGNLLMAIYVAAPWAVIKAAEPAMIQTEAFSILERSASYWAARGNKAWADAVRSFKVGLLAMGVLGVAGAALELIDLYQDHKDAQTPEEKILLKFKLGAVAAMGLGSVISILAVVFPTTFAAFAMGGVLTGILLVAGVVYLFATMLLNILKQDSLGLWLRKSCWSLSSQNQYPDTPAGVMDERNRLTEIMLSPKIIVKQTSTTRMEWMGRLGYQPKEVKTGAWIQILLPSHLRGCTVEFAVISSERTWNMEVQKIEHPLIGPFLDRGFFESKANFGSATTQTPLKQDTLHFPPVPSEGEDIVWRTWLPLQHEADFVELQIWYPQNVIAPGAQDVGYLYQIKLNLEGETAEEGLLPIELQVKSLTRQNAAKLEVPQ